MRRMCLVVVLVVAGCRGLPADVEAELRRARESAEALAVAQDATEREREAGRIAADALWQVEYAAGAVDELPAGVRERAAARAAAEAEGGK